MTRFVLLSDTHNRHRHVEEAHGLPDGDVLVHAGDFTRLGRAHEIEDFVSWFATRPHQHKVCIAGNHDFGMQEDPHRWATTFRQRGIVYLADAAATVAGWRCYGSPWTPWFHDWAFNARPGDELARICAQVSDDVEILLVHGPPHGILDRVAEPGDREDPHVGSREMLARLSALRDLRLYVCGHIHEAHGQVERDGVLFVNASSLDRRYEPVHAPVVVDLEPRC